MYMTTSVVKLCDDEDTNSTLNVLFAEIIMLGDQHTHTHNETDDDICPGFGNFLASYILRSRIKEAILGKKSHALPRDPPQSTVQ